MQAGMGLAEMVSIPGRDPVGRLSGQMWSLSHGSSASKLKARPHNPHTKLPASCHSIQNSNSISYSYSVFHGSQSMNNS